MDLWQATPTAFIEALRATGRRRAYIITDPQTQAIRPSHPSLTPIAQALGADSRDYRMHEGAFFEIGEKSGHLLAAFIHSTKRGQAAGGVRFWEYTTMEAFIRDGLRLARGMGHKCALAGLWWGGGKGVVSRHPQQDHRDPAIRRAVFQDYGRFITGLQGCYVTAEDVGTRTEDMGAIFSTTRFTTCIPQEVGGSGNPSALTALGVVVGMEAALAHLNQGSLAGKVVATQGLGNVAQFMIGFLLERKVARVVGTDVDPHALEAIQAAYPGAPLDLRVTPPGDDSIFATACDVLSPNAVGAILNPRTIPMIKAKVVCGGANNQLEELQRDGDALKERGIVYAPDFLVNRMGIVNCANEQYGLLEEDPAITAHLDRETPHGIFQRLQEVLKRAEQLNSTPGKEAEALAEELTTHTHPIWGHRGQLIINHLVKSSWVEG